MKIFKKYLAVWFVLLWVGAPAGAQVTYEGCRDFRGAPVASIRDDSIKDVAIARIENGHAVIRYNPLVLAQMSEPTRRFFYVHECAHHALQHTVQNPTLNNERAADCWAINTMKNQLGLSRRELELIQEDITRNGRGDWTHLPGPERAIDIENCLEKHGRATPVGPVGFPSGYGMKSCGCWGFNPPPLVQEPACQSGYVRLNRCNGVCQGGSSPYAYVCQ